MSMYCIVFMGFSIKCLSRVTGANLMRLLFTLLDVSLDYNFENICAAWELHTFSSQERDAVWRYHG